MTTKMHIDNERKMLSVNDLNEIKLLKAQNDGLKAQNDSLQETLNKVKTKLNEFVDKFDNISDYEDILEVKYEDETGSHYAEVTVIPDYKLDDLKNLLRDFIEFVEAIK